MANLLVTPEPLVHDAVVTTKKHSMTRALYALLMFEVVCCLGGVDAGVTTMMVKQLETAFNLNDISLAAVTLTPVAIGSGLISYPGGLLGDAYKRTAVIAGSVFLWTIATGMVIVVHSPAMLFIARLIAGIGIYGGIPAMASAICDVFPQEKRAYAFGTWNVLLAIGSGVGIASTAQIVALAERIGTVHVGGWVLAPWQLCFAMVTVISLVVGLLLLTLTEPERMDVLDVGGASTRESLAAFGTYLRRHGWLWGVYTLAQAFVGIGTSASTAWAPTLADRNFNALGPGPMGVLGVCTTTGTLIGAVSLGILCQHLTVTKRARILPYVLAALALTTAVLSVVYPFAPTWLFAAAGLGTISGVVIGFNVLGYLFVTEAVPNRVRGQLWGAMGLLWFVPGTLVPNVTAYMADVTFAHNGGFVPALAIIGGFGGAVSVMFFLACLRPYRNAVDDLRGADYA